MHRLTYSTSVFYEDTDCMGIVYHASYVRFFERGRTELLDSLGLNAAEWMDSDVLFPVYRVDVTFKAPARLRDKLKVLSAVEELSPFRLCFQQRVTREVTGQVLAVGRTELVCTNRQGQLREFPRELITTLRESSQPQRG